MFMELAQLLEAQLLLLATFQITMAQLQQVALLIVVKFIFQTMQAPIINLGRQMQL